MRSARVVVLRPRTICERLESTGFITRLLALFSTDPESLTELREAFFCFQKRATNSMRSFADDVSSAAGERSRMMRAKCHPFPVRTVDFS